MRVQTTKLGELNVKFHHERNDDFNYVSPVSNKKKAVLDTFTECVISIGPKDAVDREEYYGRAYLNPEDSFSKEMGRRLSLERALETMEVDGKTEREIWVGYYSR